jgi:sec-independent protein translocase protein TatA
MPFNIGPGELVLILLIALIIVGPGKLPDVGAAIGKSLREFRRAASDVNEATSVPTPGQGATPTPNVLGSAVAPNVLSEPAPGSEPSTSTYAGGGAQPSSNVVGSSSGTASDRSAS